MYEFKPFKQILEEGIIKSAKELAWNDLSPDSQKEYLTQAKINQEESLKKAAIKAVEDAERAFNEPGFISRADPRAYSDYRPPRKKKKNVPK